MRSAMLLAALAALGFASAACADEDFGPVSTPPAATSFRLGRLQLTSLHDGQFVVPNDGKTFGLDVGPAAVADVLRASGAPTDRITLSVNVLLVRDGRRILLLDSGLGPKLHGGLLASLKLTGVAPSAVTDVLITHPHLDHVGGLTDADGHLAFPNATVRMASDAWVFMQKQAPAALIKAIGGHVQTFAPGAAISPSVTSIAVPGHTPGHVGYEIRSGGSRLLDIGDLAHSSIVSLARPEWMVQFDNDKALARDTRGKTLPELVRSRELVFAPHFPFPGVGHIVAAGATYAWRGEVP